MRDVIRTNKREEERGSIKMFRLEKDFRFEASHRLPSHDGKCSRLHGHSWKGTLVIEAPEAALKRDGPKAGMVKDFGDLSLIMNHLIDTYLDHHHLNETTGLVNPTCEEIARWVFNMVAPKLEQPEQGRRLLVAVIIEETCTSRAEYRPEPTQPRTNVRRK